MTVDNSLDCSGRMPYAARVQIEIGNALTSYWILRNLRPDSDNLLENFKTTHLMRLLTNDLILVLHKLAGQARRECSFFQAVRYCSEDVRVRARTPACKARVNAFRTRVRPLSLVRNQRIAHSPAKDELSFSAMNELQRKELVEALCGIYESLREAVRLWDELTQTVNVYQMYGIDLRAELFGEGS